MRVTTVPPRRVRLGGAKPITRVVAAAVLAERTEDPPAQMASEARGDQAAVAAVPTAAVGAAAIPVGMAARAPSTQTAVAMAAEEVAPTSPRQVRTARARLAATAELATSFSSTRSESGRRPSAAASAPERRAPASTCSIAAPHCHYIAAGRQ